MNLYHINIYGEENIIKEIAEKYIKNSNNNIFDIDLSDLNIEKDNIFCIFDYDDITHIDTLRRLIINFPSIEIDVHIEYFYGNTIYKYNYKDNNERYEEFEYDQYYYNINDGESKFNEICQILDEAPEWTDYLDEVEEINLSNFGDLIEYEELDNLISDCNDFLGIINEKLNEKYKVNIL